MGITGTFEGAATNPCYLFNNGSYAGGQSGASVTSRYGNCLPTIGSRLEASMLNTCGCYIRLNNIQNISSYNYLKATYSAGTVTCGISLGISTNNNMIQDDFSARVNNSEVGTLILDISGFSGNYWIYVKFSASSRANNYVIYVSQIYLTTT